MPNLSSLDAHRSLPAKLTFCSWELGWRGMLLRAYEDLSAAEPFSTMPTGDQLIVLVTAGACEIESLRDGRWHRASYRPGHLGMTPPGEVATLQWQGRTAHSTLQLHLPGAVLAEVAQAMTNGARLRAFPSHLVRQDTVISSAMLALARAVKAGAPDL